MRNSLVWHIARLLRSDAQTAMNIDVTGPKIAEALADLAINGDTADIRREAIGTYLRLQRQFEIAQLRREQIKVRAAEAKAATLKEQNRAVELRVQEKRLNLQTSKEQVEISRKIKRAEKALGGV
jgi:hypothetical protein